MGEDLLATRFNMLIFRIFKKIQLSILFIFFLPYLIFSQEYIIKGTVIDKTTSQILSSVSIHDKTSLQGTITDESGNFKILLPGGEHKIEFSYTGYLRVDTTIFLSENIEISISLNPLTVSVGEITISADGVKDHVNSPLMGSFTLTNDETALSFRGT
jgi:hypothetical protein